ncbi:MAG: MFS transporter [Candidatus Planktophila sp.]
MKRWLSRNLLILTLVSLAQDAASELLYPLLPYIVTAGAISAAPFVLGLIEGAAEAAAGFTKLYSGNKSDSIGRKPFVIAGYSIAGFGKALVVFGTTWGTVFLGRITDRIGKGMRSAPRDALIHDSVPREDLGKAFGFHRTGDNVGAVIGPLIALLGLSLLNNDVRVVAMWALFPAALSAILTIFVRENIIKQKSEREEKSESDITPIPAPLKRAIGVLVVIQLTNIPDALLLLRLYDLKFSVTSVVIAYAMYSLVTAIFAFPGGYLADKFSPQIVYAIGLIAFAVAYATLGLTTSKSIALIALMIYGIFPALTDGVGKAWIAQLSESAHRGRAQGIYQAGMNFAVLGAGIWGGALWASGPQQPVLWLAALGALLGSIYLGATWLIKDFTHRR